LGLLVNMGMDRVQIERMAYDPPETELVENWDSWQKQIDGEDRAVGIAVRDALRAVFSEHTTGYGEEVLTKLVLFALRQQGLRVVANPVAKAFFHGIEVHESSLACLVVNERITLVLSALFDTNEFNANRCRSYLNALSLHWGIAADFGKKRAEIIGIRQRK
jgi:GxxExxY protein